MAKVTGIVTYQIGISASDPSVIAKWPRLQFALQPGPRRTADSYTHFAV